MARRNKSVHTFPRVKTIEIPQVLHSNHNHSAYHHDPGGQASIYYSPASTQVQISNPVIRGDFSLLLFIPKKKMYKKKQKETVKHFARKRSKDFKIHFASFTAIIVFFFSRTLICRRYVSLNGLALTFLMRFAHNAHIV